MTQLPPLPASWRHFKRAQDGGLAAATLLFAAAAVYAWTALPGVSALKLEVIVAFPLIFAALVVLAGLLIEPLRRTLRGYVGLSYRTGFGQDAKSILFGVGLLSGVALFLWWEILRSADGGHYPTGAFSAYGAGIGVLLTQCILTRLLERDPEVRKVLGE